MASNLEPKINRIATAVTSALSALTAKGVTVPEGANVESLAALIEAIEAGGGGINATAGTITVASDQNDYVLNHGLGEVPKFFVIGMINSLSKLTGKTYLLIGAYGFSDVATQYRISATAANSAPTGIFVATAIDSIGHRANIVNATDTTITVASSTGTFKLISGATYYWVAVGSGVF